MIVSVFTLLVLSRAADGTMGLWSRGSKINLRIGENWDRGPYPGLFTEADRGASLFGRGQ